MASRRAQVGDARRAQIRRRLCEQSDGSSPSGRHPRARRDPCSVLGDHGCPELDERSHAGVRDLVVRKATGPSYLEQAAADEAPEVRRDAPLGETRVDDALGAGALVVGAEGEKRQAGRVTERAIEARQQLSSGRILRNRPDQLCESRACARSLPEGRGAHGAHLFAASKEPPSCSFAIIGSSDHATALADPSRGPICANRRTQPQGHPSRRGADTGSLRGRHGVRTGSAKARGGAAMPAFRPRLRPRERSRRPRAPASPDLLRRGAARPGPRRHRTQRERRPPAGAPLAGRRARPAMRAVPWDRRCCRSRRPRPRAP